MLRTPGTLALSLIRSLALSGTIAAAPALAQPQDPPRPIASPATLADADTIATTLVQTALYERIIAQAVSRAERNLTTKVGESSSDRMSHLSHAMRQALPQKDVLVWTAQVFQQHFTSEELHLIAAFYRTSAGQKLQANVEPLMKQVLTQIQGALEAHGPDTLHRAGYDLKDSDPPSGHHK